MTRRRIDTPGRAGWRSPHRDVTTSDRPASSAESAHVAAGSTTAEFADESTRRLVRVHAADVADLNSRRWDAASLIGAPYAEWEERDE
jgi:hypothetical protein